MDRVEVADGAVSLLAARVAIQLSRDRPYDPPDRVAYDAIIVARRAPSAAARRAADVAALQEVLQRYGATLCFVMHDATPYLALRFEAPRHCSAATAAPFLLQRCSTLRRKVSEKSES